MPTCLGVRKRPRGGRGLCAARLNEMIGLALWNSTVLVFARGSLGKDHPVIACSTLHCRACAHFNAAHLDHRVKGGAVRRLFWPGQVREFVRECQNGAKRTCAGFLWEWSTSIPSAEGWILPEGSRCPL
eukprot:gene8042-biopygen19608